MNKIQITARRRAVDAALGSVRAEGLKPSVKTQKQVRLYADGKITAEQLHASVMLGIKKKVKTGK